MPERIRRSRTKGWRMPPNTVYVGRPTLWGNPFEVGRDGDAQYCVEEYRKLLTGVPVSAWPKDPERLDAAVTFAVTPELVRDQLRGKYLACWCPLDQPCHADVLLEIANNPLSLRPAVHFIGKEPTGV